LLAFTLALSTTGLAGAVTITFENGGIGLTSTNTDNPGSSAEPWLIEEAMTGAGTLKFGDEPLGTDDDTGANKAAGKWFSKTVRNDTQDTWTSFELELQVTLGIPSPQADGLSFADGTPVALAFTSDVFPTYTRIDLVRDYLNFHGGSVLPSHSVTFNFAITDTAGNDPFYLLQTPNRSEIAEPGTLVFLAAGLAFLALGWPLRRRARPGSPTPPRTRRPQDTAAVKIGP
jgi:hypothetical protein